MDLNIGIVQGFLSPSSRRAWIEMVTLSALSTTIGVALLAEGVDRNIGGLVNWPSEETSPSSRRAWIEMLLVQMNCRASSVALLAEGVDRNSISDVSWTFDKVALLAEGVDRNNSNKVTVADSYSRPPRGGRG